MEQTKTNCGGLRLEDMAYLYATTKEDTYFNQLWYSVKLFAIKITNKYPSIEMEDKLSIAMECLMNACNGLKPGQNLLTLYGTILNNRFCDLWGKKMQTGRYKLNADAYSLDKLQEDINFQPSYEDNLFNLDLFNIECKLVGIELKMVGLIYEGYTRTEIRKQLKLTIENYNNILQGIKDKICNNYLDEELVGGLSK